MSELISNGDFASGSGWTPGTNWSISGGQAIAAAATTGQFLSQPVSVIKGGVYQVTFDVANYSSGDVRASFDSGDNGTARSANGTFVESITLTAAATVLRFGRSTGDFTGRIDNVKLQGMPAVIDETGLSLALSAANGSYASPSLRARAIIQAYLNGGTGTTATIAINETAMSLANEILVRGSFQSLDRQVRAAIAAYAAQTAA